MLGANAFRPYTSGNSAEQVFVGDPNGSPFIVRAREGSWLPLNVIIFAASEEDAIERVKEGLRKSIELSYTGNWEERFTGLLALFDNPENVEVCAFDKTYVCKISWDSRGLA